MALSPLGQSHDDHRIKVANLLHAPCLSIQPIPNGDKNVLNYSAHTQPDGIYSHQASQFSNTFPDFELQAPISPIQDLPFSAGFWSNTDNLLGSDLWNFSGPSQASVRSIHHTSEVFQGEGRRVSSAQAPQQTLGMSVGVHGYSEAQGFGTGTGYRDLGGDSGGLWNLEDKQNEEVGFQPFMMTLSNPANATEPSTGNEALPIHPTVGIDSTQSHDTETQNISHRATPLTLASHLNLCSDCYGFLQCFFSPRYDMSRTYKWYHSNPRRRDANIHLGPRSCEVCKRNLSRTVASTATTPAAGPTHPTVDSRRQYRVRKEQRPRPLIAPPARASTLYCRTAGCNRGPGGVGFNRKDNRNVHEKNLHGVGAVAESPVASPDREHPPQLADVQEK